MVKREREDSQYSTREQEEICNYFADIDQEKAQMTAQEIATIERVEGGLDRYIQRLEAQKIY